MFNLLHRCHSFTYGSRMLCQLCTWWHLSQTSKYKNTWKEMIDSSDSVISFGIRHLAVKTSMQCNATWVSEQKKSRFAHDTARAKSIGDVRSETPTQLLHAASFNRITIYIMPIISCSLREACLILPLLSMSIVQVSWQVWPLITVWCVSCQCYVNNKSPLLE